jgi:chemotaxis signal transduction protein
METNKTVSMAKHFYAFRLGGYHIALPGDNNQKVIQHDLLKNNNPLPFLVKFIYNDGIESFPVIDTRLKLGMSAFDGTEETCIFIENFAFSKITSFKIGLLMNKYLGYYPVAPQKIKFWPNGVMDEFNDFISGICKINDKDHLMLSLKNIFRDEEIKEFYELRQRKMVENSYIPIYNGCSAL